MESQWWVHGMQVKEIRTVPGSSNLGSLISLMHLFLPTAFLSGPVRSRVLSHMEPADTHRQV